MYTIDVAHRGINTFTLQYETKEAALKEWDDLIEYGKAGDKLILTRTSEVIMIIATATVKGKEYI